MKRQINKLLRIVSLALLSLVALICCVVVSSCSWDTPSVNKMRKILDTYEKEMGVVVDYLMTFSSNVTIYDDNGKILYYAYTRDENGQDVYTIETAETPPQDVSAAIKTLWKAGCKSIDKNSRYGNKNTISFEFWSQTIKQQTCGLARTINGRGLPMVQCQITCSKIRDSWFYYYTNYEEWRNDRDGYDRLFLSPDDSKIDGT